MKNYLLILAVLLVAGLAGRSFIKVETPPTKTDQSAISLETQTNSEGAVIVTAQPVNLTVGQPSIFHLTLSTHSVDLGYDLKATARVTADQNTTLLPDSWDGGSTGHHLDGNLVFPALPVGTSQITLTVPGIDGHDRVFKWSIR